MQWSDGVDVFSSIKSSVDNSDKEMNELYLEMINAAVEYAQIRTKWMVSDRNTRIEIEKQRTSLYNSFISCCNALSRLMSSKTGYYWMDVVGNDSKDIGDFACYIHCILGIQAR